MTNYLIFGGLKTLDHFVWISGEGTYKAPKRSVEYISVPGRNGDLIVDNGKWENIEVTYPAFIPYDFPEHMKEFRAELCKKLGYHRLEDTYHPDEFRLASFSDGLEPSTTQWNKGGTFDLSFNCKPQRYLKSGEEALQFMPLYVSAGGAASGYIPTGTQPVNISATMPEGQTGTLTIETFNASGTAVNTYEYSISSTSAIQRRFLASEKYFRIRLAGISDIDTVNLQIDTNMIINGEAVELSAKAGRKITISNPTGYPAKPLIECFTNISPYFEIRNYENGEQLDEYIFRVNDTGVSHFFIDCDVQYVYDEAKNNLTEFLFLTSAESAVGEGLVFPELTGDTTELYMYYAGVTFGNGIGLVNIYPRWWRL